MLRKLWKYMSGKSNFIPSMDQVIMWFAIGLGMYHIGLLTLYACCGMDILTLVNVFSVLLYAACAYGAWKKIKALYLLRIFYAEIIMQVLVAGALLGAQCGFDFYLIAITCHAFHTGYIYREDEKVNAMHYVLIDSAAFILFRIFTAKITPLYYFSDPWVAEMLYDVNYFTAIIVIVMSMSTLLIQIAHLEGRLIQKNRDLEVLSHTDALTGLVNRRSIEENYEYVMQHSKMYALILSDIDDFKKINDTYGHNIGDVVLQNVAEIFKGAVREDDIVCRWGGEEILVFLPLCKKKGAELTAQRIMERIRKARIPSGEGDEICFTMTFGISDSGEGEDLHKVVQKADARLYDGKTSGKNCIVSE